MALFRLKNAEKFLSQQILPKMAKHHEGLRSFDFQAGTPKEEGIPVLKLRPASRFHHAVVRDVACL